MGKALREILVLMDLLALMVLKAKREHRVTQVQWALKDCQVLLDVREKLGKMEL